MRLGLLARLARRPRWLVGIAADVGGYVFEALALAAGAVVLVEPILSTALLLSLFLGAAINKRHVGRLVVGRRRRARGRRGTVRQIGVRRPGGHATALAVVVTGRSAAARRRRGLYRWGSCHVGAQPARALLGAGTGVAFGVTALLQRRGSSSFLGDGVFAWVRRWEPYALAVCSIRRSRPVSEQRFDRLARGSAGRVTGHAAAHRRRPRCRPPQRGRGHHGAASSRLRSPVTMVALVWGVVTLAQVEQGSMATKTAPVAEP